MDCYSPDPGMEGFCVSKCRPVSENGMNIELFVENYSDFNFSIFRCENSLITAVMQHSAVVPRNSPIYLKALWVKYFFFVAIIDVQSGDSIKSLGNTFQKIWCIIRKPCIRLGSFRGELK